MKNKYFFNTLGVVFTLGLLLLFGNVQGQNRYYLDFDGSNDYVYRIDNSVLDRMNSASEYTIEAWIYISTWKDYERIANRYSHWDFYLRKNGQLAFRVDVSGTWKRNYSVNSAVSTGSWQHVVVIRESGHIHFYVNGINKDAGTYSGYTLPGPSTNDHLYIGQFGSSTAGGKGTNLFNGYIDEFRCKNVAENVADLSSSIYDNQYSPDSHTGALFHFNEGSGTNTIESTQGYNATLYGTPTWRAWNYVSSDHLPLAHEWTGGAGTDWGTAGNWNGGTPAGTNDVLVPSGLTNYPSVSGDASTPSVCNNLLVESGASLTIPVGKALTVNGDLTNNAAASNLTISSDVNGNGSLIVNGTVTGSATVRRYLGGFYSTSSNGWHEIASPVNNMSISGSSFVPGTHDDLYAWDEANNVWSNYKQSNGSHPFTAFTNGEGYLVADSLTATETFTGTLNNTDVSFSNLSHTAGKGNGWHLLGNPFSSALKWGTANWDSLNVVATAKIWNESKGNYDDVTVDGDNKVIPSTNGFFIQVTSGTNSLTIPAADRVHDAANNYKSASATNPKETLTFKVSNDANGYYDISTLGFKAHATEGFDMAFDSHKLFSIVKTAPSLWTKSDAQDFSTNYLPETTTAYDVPLHFKPGVSTVYHLTIKGADSFDNTGLVLEDLKTGEKIDLSNTGSYDFSANKGDDVNRFVLHINSVTAVPNVNETDGIQVFSYGNTVYLHGQHMLNGKVSIFNTLGQKVYDGLLNGAAKQQIRVNQHEGIYFVRVEENNHVFTKKVFIQ